MLARGVAASPGAAKGEVVFTAAEAVEAAERGPGRDPRAAVHRGRRRRRLPRRAGDPHLARAARRRTRRWWRAAWAGRRWSAPSALAIDLKARTITVDGTKVGEGDLIAIDGTKGCVTLEDVPLVDAEVNEHFERVLEWADEVRRLGVRANADTPADAARARELGAEGIGLCRTEHMFMDADRQPKMRAMIMADDEEDRRAALAELLPLQQEDFEGLFEAMEGLPVTIRLLDPPLHEFLPSKSRAARERERARGRASPTTRGARAARSRASRDLEEVNPMLGTRGCRLGILYPEIYEMQVGRSCAAAVRERTGSRRTLEIMIPLVDYEQELRADARARRAGRRRARLDAARATTRSAR